MEKSQNQKKMTLAEIKDHLKYECPLTMYECLNCFEKIKLQQITKPHDITQCIETLKKKVEGERSKELGKENRRLEQEI